MTSLRQVALGQIRGCVRAVPGIPRSMAAALALCGLALLAAPWSVEAKPIIGCSTVDRPINHTVFWCPINFYHTISFIADGPEAEVRFTGRIRATVGGNEYLNNRIDNVCLVRKDIHDANLVTISNDPDLWCSQFTIQAFNFPAVPQQDIVFLDTFPSGLGPQWDTSDWAFWVTSPASSPSAPNNIVDPEPSPIGGSLGFGQMGDPDTLSTTGFAVNGLTEGVEYVVSFFWKCTANDNVIDLWVDIFGTEFWNDATEGALTDNFGPVAIAWGDVDQDRDEDFYLSDFNLPNQLFGNADGLGFADLSSNPIDDPGPGQGVAWADADNDGYLDLYLVQGNQPGGPPVPNKLFRGIADGLFADATSGPLGHMGPGRGVGWADYDLDGDVDLYVTNFGSGNLLLRNDGGLVFADVTNDLLRNLGSSTGVAWGDYDNDKDPDLYFANYGQPNKLFRNDGGVLVDVTSASLGDPSNSTGVAWGDFDNDLDLDLFVANDMAPCRLLRNDGGGSFTNVASGLLLESRPVHGVVWLDGDNDGDLDLYLTLANEANRYFRNDGGGVLVHMLTDMDDPGNGRGVAAADFDEDGDLDVYLCNQGQSGRLYRNDYAYGGDWLEVRLVGVQSNRAAIGARIKVTTSGTARTRSQIREISGGSGYLSQNSLVAHFGLGGGTTMTQVQVCWPSGVVQEFFNAGMNQVIVYTEPGTGGTPGPETEGPRVRLLGNHPNPFLRFTRIAYELEMPLPVAVSVYDLRGGFVRLLDRAAARPAGRHELVWDGTDGLGRPVPGGVYFYRLDAGSERRVGRMMVAP